MGPDQITKIEEAKTRAAYRAGPDSEAEADDWSTAEEFIGDEHS